MRKLGSARFLSRAAAAALIARYCVIHTIMSRERAELRMPQPRIGLGDTDRRMSSSADLSEPSRFLRLRARTSDLSGALLRPAVLALIFFLLYATYSLSRYSQNFTAGHDLGIFDQAVRHYSQLRAPEVALKGSHYNILGDHFHPILALLAPLYWIWNDPRTLLLAQAALLAASVPIVYRFCRRYIGQSWAVVLAAAYGLGWPLEAAVDYDFHEIAFAVPLLTWAVDALDRKEDKQLLIAASLLLLVREDLGLVLVVIGGLRAIRVPRRPGFVLVCLGGASYALVTSVLIPFFASDGKFAYWSYQALGPDLPSALQALVFHPLRAAKLFVTPSVKAATLLWIFAPVTFLCLRSPLVLTAAPLLAERFFSSRPSLWTTEFHYTAVAWPLIFLAAVDGARRFRQRPQTAEKALFCCLVLLVPIIGIATDPSRWPLQRLFSGDAFTKSAHMRDQAALLRDIPGRTCVAGDDRLAPHLTHSNVVSKLDLNVLKPDFIALDMSEHDVEDSGPTTTESIETATALGYRVTAAHGSLLLFKSPSYRGSSKWCTP